MSEDIATPHYICTGGCHGLSDTPGTCQADDCPKHGHELIRCDCTDPSSHEDPSETSA